MKNKTLYQLIALSMLLLTTISCKEELSYSRDDENLNNYMVSWIRTYGIIDQNQDWNMARRIEAVVDPSMFGEGYSINIYNADPLNGGVLIGRTDKNCTLNLDVEKKAKTVFVRAYDPSHTVFTTSVCEIDRNRVVIEPSKATSRGDLVFHDADESEEPDNAYQWLLACEDLGGSFDIDFNDVVIGINYVAGEDKLTITPMAAGGALGANVYYDDVLLFEIHEAITGQVAETGKYDFYHNTRDKDSWEGAGRSKVCNNVGGFTITDKMGKIRLEILKKSGNENVTTIIEAAPTGTPPQMICVPGQWEWPTENSDIKNSYPGFTAWNKDATVDSWDAVKNVNIVVKRPRPGSSSGNGDEGGSTPVMQWFRGTTPDWLEDDVYFVRINCEDESSMISVKSGETYSFDTELTTCQYMFADNYYYLETLELHIDTSNAISMNSMFSNCPSLHTLTFDLPLNTSSCQDFGSMFYDCESLESLDFSDFDWTNITNSSDMFYNCKSLQSLKLGDVGSDNLEQVSGMFMGCENLEELEVDSWTMTDIITNTSRMFLHCSKISNMDVSDWDASNWSDCSMMFYGCSNLPSLDVSNWDLRNLQYANGMFAYCYNLAEVDMSQCGLDQGVLEDTSEMFAYCDGLQTIDVANWNMSNVTSISRMFMSCTFLQSVDVSSWDVSNVEDASQLFSGDQQLQSLDVSNWDTSSMTNMNSMFNNCRSLRTLDVSNFNTRNVTDMGGMFDNLHSLETGLVVTGPDFKTDNVIKMDYMFFGYPIDNLDVSTFNTEKVENMMFMFAGSALATLDLGSFHTPALQDMQSMFFGCLNLAELNMPYFDATNFSYEYYRNINIFGIYDDNWQIVTSERTLNIHTNSAFKQAFIDHAEYVKLPYCLRDGNSTNWLTSWH